jgi:glucose/arabinose dehydrogenase
MKTLEILVATGAFALAACGRGDAARSTADTAAPAAATASATDPCSGDAGGITLPAGFCATVFADSIGHARHAAVASNGDVYVNTWSGSYYSDKPREAGFIVALRDTNHDGRADVVTRFGPTPSAGGKGGTGIALRGDMLFVEENGSIVRYALTPGTLGASAKAESIVHGLPLTGDHPMHPFAIDSAGAMYVNSGSATNSCQVKNRTLDSPGHKPCTELATRGGIWRFDANKAGQAFTPAARYATGIRNAVGIAIGPDGGPYSTQHGRDQLFDNWPKLYTTEQGQNLPAEQLMKIEQGADYGWPTCYFDGAQQKLVLAPEYGGDGKAVGECAQKTAPIAFFPAHWAPDGLLFYTGSQFPERYRGGALIAFHGSWNRAPGPQGGYKVAFVPFVGGKPQVSRAEPEAFADGFAGAVVQPDKAAHRPVGLALGPDGAVYITDDQAGRVWRVTYGRPPQR